MNIEILNTVNLDGTPVTYQSISNGGGGSNSGGGGSTPKYTGHADAEGLKAIGWTEDDIAYYQASGVNWNEEDDQYHLVSDDNKALYGVLTAYNISTYKDRIVYLPKIDTSGKTNMDYMFQHCHSLTAIPMLDTSNVTSMYRMFNECASLVSIPMLDVSNVTDMNEMFKNCYSLMTIPQWDTSNLTNMGSMFYGCYSLKSIPKLDTSKVMYMGNMFYNCRSLTNITQLDTSSTTSVDGMFVYCSSLVSMLMLDTSNMTSASVFSSCHALTHAYLKNVKLAYDLSNAQLLTKDSLLYIINNEAATEAITIKLASYAYSRWANDPDIVAALANHLNISLAKS